MSRFELGQAESDKYGQLWTIVKRTSKTVWAFGDIDKEVKRFKIQESSNSEYFLPYGRYSQAPTISAV